MFQTHEIVSTLNKYSGALLFLTFCIIGLFTFDVYGISWDEDYQREIGLVSWNYIFSNDQTLINYPMHDYGVGFELPLIALEKLFGFEDKREIYLMRHAFTHLFFLVAAYYCHKLILLLYNDRLLALIGFLLFVIFPPIYAHSFFNTKDLPFLSLLTICFYFTAKAIKQKSSWNFIALGMALGLLINIRMMGILLLFCVITFLVLEAILKKQVLKPLKLLVLMLLACSILLVLSWPYLWSDPYGNFSSAFSNMSKFPWPGTNLFKGELIRGTQISWDYIPTWFVITTPISYLSLGVLGISALVFTGIKKPAHFFDDAIHKNTVIYLICFFVPVLAVIVLQSVLYDAWRHLYFIYPSFVLLGVYGLHVFLPRFKRLLVFYVFGSILFVGVYMIRNFPTHYVYFNYFVSCHSEPNYLRKHYEMDYWGPSFKQALEYVLKTDPSDSLKIYVESYSTSNLPILFKPEERKRFHLVNAEDADYFITNYRGHPNDYDFAQKPVYSITVLNSSVIDVFKMK